MRILTIWPAGMGSSGIGRLKSLKARGIDVGLICAVEWPEGGSNVKPPADAGFPIYPRRTAFTGRGAYYFYPGGVGGAVKDFRPDLIHFREEVYNVAGAQLLIERRLRFPRIPFVFESWQNIRKRYPKPAGWFERAGYSSAAGAIAGAPGVESVLRQGGFSGPIEVIPLGGIDMTTLTPEGPTLRDQLPSGPIVGYAGRLVEAKAIDDLILATKVAEGVNALAIAGDGPERIRLEALARSEGIQAAFLGPLREEQIPSFLRSLDVLVLPSRTTARWKEQWGRVLTEAMACGIPVIGSDSGEIPFVVGDAGIIFPEGDVASLAGAISKVVSDPDLGFRLKVMGLNRVKEFTFDMLAERTESFYRRVLA